MAQKQKISRHPTLRIRSSLRTIHTTRGKPRAVRTVISTSYSKHLLTKTRIGSSREGKTKVRDCTARKTDTSGVYYQRTYVYSPLSEDRAYAFLPHKKQTLESSAHTRELNNLSPNRYYKEHETQ